MWIFNFVLFLIFVFAAGILFFFNQGATVQHLSLFFKEFNQLPLTYLLLETFLAGAVWAFLFSIAMEIRLRLKNRKYKKKAKSLQKEVDKLRTESIENVDLPEEE